MLLAFFAVAPDAAVGVHTFTAAVAAVASDAVMLALADAGALAVLALTPAAVMLADAGAPAVLAGSPRGKYPMVYSVWLVVVSARTNKRHHHHWLLMRLCGQMLAPPQSLRVLLRRICWQMPAAEIFFLAVMPASSLGPHCAVRSHAAVTPTSSHGLFATRTVTARPRQDHVLPRPRRRWREPVNSAALQAPWRLAERRPGLSGRGRRCTGRSRGRACG